MLGDDPVAAVDLRGAAGPPGERHVRREHELLEAGPEPGRGRAGPERDKGGAARLRPPRNRGDVHARHVFESRSAPVSWTLTALSCANCRKAGANRRDGTGTASLR